MKCFWAAAGTAAVICSLVPASASAGAPPTTKGERDPLVIGHRGASGYLPEHTLESYALAIELGADYIEPDLVSTSDGHLIARHEPNLIATTDVAQKFPQRLTTKTVDGIHEPGYFASDFTLAEIKTLRAKQSFADRPQQFNGLYEIPTFGEILALAKRAGKERGRAVGVYPETKHPTFHETEGVPLEGALVQALRRAGLNRWNAPVFIQSFEQSNLQRLNRMTHVRLVQLVDACDVNDAGVIIYCAPWDRPYDWTASGDPDLLARTFGYFTTNAGLAEIASYADGIGPWKPYIQSTAKNDANRDGTIGDENGDGTVDGADRGVLPPTTLVDRAHDAGLKIHTWTFRNEAYRLAYEDDGDPINEYLRYFEIGVDGVFSDFPDTALEARAEFLGD